MQQIIGDFERVPGIMAAADPEKLRQGHAGCGGRYRIERIVGIDVGANLKVGS